MCIKTYIINTQLYISITTNFTPFSLQRGKRVDTNAAKGSKIERNLDFINFSYIYRTLLRVIIYNTWSYQFHLSTSFAMHTFFLFILFPSFS